MRARELDLMVIRTRDDPHPWRSAPVMIRTREGELDDGITAHFTDPQTQGAALMTNLTGRFAEGGFP